MEEPVSLPARTDRSHGLRQDAELSEPSILRARTASADLHPPQLRSLHYAGSGAPGSDVACPTNGAPTISRTPTSMLCRTTTTPRARFSLY